MNPIIAALLLAFFLAPLAYISLLFWLEVFSALLSDKSKKVRSFFEDSE